VRQNFKRDKKRIEEAKKKKREEKRNAHLNEKPLNTFPGVLPEPPSSVIADSSIDRNF